MTASRGKTTASSQAHRVSYGELAASRSLPDRPKINLRKPRVQPKTVSRAHPARLIAAGLVGIALVGGVVLGLHRLDGWLARSPLFAIRKIGVEGNKHLAKEEVISCSGIKLGQGLYAVDLEKVTARVAANPWVKKATVSRRPPQALLIRIVEREPIAMMTSAGRLYAIARDTVAMPLSSSIPDLPLFTNVRPDSFRVGRPLKSERLRVLFDFVDRAREIDETFVTKISDLRPAGWGSVAASLMATGLEVRMKLDGLEEQIDRLKGILNRSEFYGEGRVSYVDLRFADQVVVGLEKGIRNGR